MVFVFASPLGFNPTHPHNLLLLEIFHLKEIIVEHHKQKCTINSLDADYNEPRTMPTKNIGHGRVDGEKKQHDASDTTVIRH